MNEAVREAREEAAERELTGRSNDCVRTVDEASAVQAALERALTAHSPPQPRSTVPVNKSMMVSLTAKSMNKRPWSGRVFAVVRTVAANGGLSLQRWNRREASQESAKGGQRS
jgi:hypothetical protein